MAFSKYSISMDIPAFVMTIIKRLNSRGFGAYVVGGAIRDMFLGRPAIDWDVATSASTDKVRGLFHDIRSFTLKHETVTLVYSGHHYEITTVRGSGDFEQRIKEDLGHRDFTINAMAYDIDRNIVLDPNGGREDIVGKRVRAVGNPVERFREDPIRLLRAVRIAVELGFRIENRTMETIRGMSDQLALAARERVRDEFMKILMIQKPSDGFRILRRSDLLSQFLPELLEGFRKKQNFHHRHTIYRHIMETIDRVEPTPVLRLAALFHDIAKPRVRRKIEGEFRFFDHAQESAFLAGEIMARLRFSREMIKEVTNLIEHHMINYDTKWSDGAIRRLVRRVDPENMDSLISLRGADLSARGDIDGKLTLLSELKKRVEKLRKESIINDTGDLAVGGEKIMDILEIPAGPDVGRVLKILLEKVTDHPYLNTEERLTDILKDIRDKKIVDKSV